MAQHLLSDANVRIDPATDKVALAINAVTTAVTTSQTIQVLLGAALNTSTKQVTILPSGNVYMALGGAASASSMPLAANVAYQFGVTSTADLRFYAAGATVISIVQEG
jgi:hypothetical protein